MINNYDSVVACPYTATPHSQKQEGTSYTATKRNWLSFVTVLVTLFCFSNVQGQTTILIDPTGDGGFENGTTLTANGWTAVNSAQSFFVGAPTAASLGSNCAYTSTTSGAWTAGTASSVTHIYKDVVIPAGETILTFSLKYKTSFVDATYDFLKVHLVPTTTTPVAGTQLATGQLGANTDGTTAYATYNFNTTVTGGTTQRVVISFKNDGASPYGSAAIDEISLTSRAPIAPDAAPINFTPTAVTQTGMTVNWLDNSTNETSFRVYRSTDNVTFSQVGTDIVSTSSGTTGTAYNLPVASGLIPGVTYYYRIVAFADLETSYLTGSQATNPPGTITSIASGNWSQTSTWSSGAIPTATDNVIIADGHTVNIDLVAPTCLDLTVGQGASGVLTFTSTSAATLSVNGSITVGAGGIFNAGSATSIVHNIFLGGVTATSPYASNLIVDGSFDMWLTATTGRATLTFFGILNSTISGSGTIDLNNTNIINKGATTATALVTPPVLDVQKAFTVQAASTLGFVATHTAGTIKISGTFTQSNPIFTIVGYTIPATGGIWLSNPNFTIAGLTGSPSVNGLFRVTAGTYNIGTSSGNSLGSGANSVYIIEGGAINVAGRFNLTSTGVYYNQSDGTISVANVGNTTVASASFGITSTSASFIMSGGTIVLVQRNGGTLGSTTRDYYNVGTPTITGGTLQVGTAATATNFNFRLYGYAPNININNTTNNKIVQVHQSTGVLYVFGTLTVNPGTTFDCLGMTAFALGNVVNNGIIQGLVSGSRFDFSGTTPQTYSGTGTFGTSSAPFIGTGVGIANYTNVTLSAPIVTTRTNLFGGSFINSNQITIGSGGTSTGFVQRGGSTADAGSFDVSPTFNIGTGGLTLSYATSTVNTTTGFEIPATRTVNSVTVNNTNGVTLAGGNLTALTTLALTNGIVTTGANTLILGDAATVGTLTGGSDTAYVNGALTRSIANANTNATYIPFPIGKSGVYTPIAIAPATTSIALFKAESFGTNSGTEDPSIIGLSATRRFEALPVSGTFTDINVRLSDAGIVSTNIPVQATTSTGAYTSAFGSTSTFVAGPPITLTSNTAVTSANYTGYLSYANSNACSGTPAPGNTIPSTNAICLGTSVTLSLQNATSGTGVTYQWKSSTDGTTYNPISGATNATLTVTPSAPLYYVCDVTCATGPATGTSTAVQITFTNSVTAATPGTRCGTGTVDLSATPSAGASIKWYAAETGGTVLGTGNSFTTPSIAATTTYYAGSESTSPGTAQLGTGTTTSGLSLSAFNNYRASAKYHMIYTASELAAIGLSAGDISSIAYKVTSLGDAATNANYTVKIGNTSLATFANTTFTAPTFITCYGPSTYTHTASGWQTINFSTPYTWDGISNIIIEVSHDGADGGSSANTEYTATTGNTVLYSYNGSNFNNTLSTNRFNVLFAGQLACQSARVPVVATVTTPPLLTLSTPTATICESNSTAVTLTSTAGDYNTYTWSPSTGIVPGGDENTGWTFNPSVSTNYTLTATQTGGSLCTTTATFAVTVNPRPSAMTITPSPAPVCVDAIQALVVNGGTLNNVSILNENFNASTNSWTVLNTSTGGTPADANWTLRNSGYVYSTLGTFISNDASQFYLSNSDDQGNGGTTNTALISPSFATTNFTAATVSFWHYFRQNGTAKVQYSIDGGTAWTDIQSYTATTGAIGGFVQANLALPAGALNQANVKIRFKYDAVWQYFWAIDNVSISGTQAQTITWLPIDNLYTDASATIPYVTNGNASTVYFKSSITAAAVTYTATSTTSFGCSRTATTDVTVNSNNTVTAASSSPTVCINTAITDITHTTTGATGFATTTTNYGLPAGVTAVLASNTITISGTPTASGTFNYDIPLTGGCGTVSATGTITVTAINTASAASSTPTVCINTAITDITHTTTGATGFATTTTNYGLPAGVTAVLASNTITISGTPTASGTFNYDIPLTGGCGTVSATGTITVSAINTVSTASSTPTVCINTAITDITHTTTGATGFATTTTNYGLPAGVTAVLASNTITISGTPTASGTFNYDIPLTGGCGTVSATGTITVTPLPGWFNTQFPSSASICEGGSAVIYGQVYLAGITDPAGQASGMTAQLGYSSSNTDPNTWTNWINASFNVQTGNNDEFQANIGSSLGVGTYFYAFRYSYNGCTYVYGGLNGPWNGTTNNSGTLTITANNTASAASSSPTVCINTAITAITHTTTGATGFATTTTNYGLPAGVTAVLASNTITISGTPTASGTFNYDIPLTGGCGTVSATGTITVTAASTNSTTISACGSYTWSVNGTTYTTSGTYTSVVGCLTETLNLTINALPVTTITRAGDDLTATETGATYQWYNCTSGSVGTIISGATSQSYTATASGSYAVQVTKNGCSEMSACFDVATLSGNSFDLAKLSYYPNPVIDVLTISYTNEITSVQVYDISGRLVRDMKPNSNEVTVDLSDLAASVYVVKVFADTTSGEFKVVKK